MPRHVLAVVAVLCLALTACTDRGTQGEPDQFAGRPLPEVDVAAAADGAVPPDDVLVDGGWPEVAAFVAESAAQDKATVVNIFASWCAPCERELPLLLATSEQTPDVRWLGVASEDRRQDAEPFVERMAVTWPSVLDMPATTHIELDGIAMPTTAFFDADGQLRQVVIGELDEEELTTALEGLRTPAAEN